jgi:hypothetical protein
MQEQSDISASHTVQSASHALGVECNFLLKKWRTRSSDRGVRVGEVDLVDAEVTSLVGQDMRHEGREITR